MVSAAQLDALMQQALADKQAEPAFFRALLDATIYAHTPRSARSGRLQLIQFPLPDSDRLVLPFFSDETQARAAAGAAATVVVLTGRQLFELTRGATLMLNPNGASCTLYPEEIAALLDRGELAVIDQVDVADPQPMEFREPEPPPAWLIDPLIALYAQLPAVDVAYLVEVRAPNDPDPEHVTLLIALGVAAADTEHAARATIATIQPLCRSREVGADLTAFAPDAVPDWLADSGLTPFYVRALGQRLVRGSAVLQ